MTTIIQEMVKMTLRRNKPKQRTPNQSKRARKVSKSIEGTKLKFNQSHPSHVKSNSWRKRGSKSDTVP